MPSVGAVRHAMPIPMGVASGRSTCGASHRSTSSTSMDFGAYLLSASPPVNFAFSYAVNHRGPTCTNGIDSDCNGNQRKVGCWGDVPSLFDVNSGRWTVKDGDDRSTKKREVSPSQRLRKTGCLTTGVSSETTKLNAIRSCLRIQALADDKLTRTVSSPPNLSFSGNISKVKKVSFADDIGRKLFVVRIFEEMPDTPSLVDPLVLQRYTSVCASSSCPDLTSLAAPETSASPVQKSTVSQEKSSVILLPNFSMPAAGYVVFRKKIEEEFVSLESVHQQESTGVLCGTVKVKEVTFEKSVFIRCTFDNWANQTDIQATYSPPRDPHGGRPPPFATFSFRIELPTNLTHPIKNVQFAVCYRTAGKEFWDSNSGMNYELSTPDWASSGSRGSSRDKQNINGNSSVSSKDSDNCADYASWNEVDSSVPYW